MNQHMKPPAINRAPSKDYTLALIRVVSRRLKHIDEEVVSIGVALSNGLVTAAKARELVDDIAPGCIDVSPFRYWKGQWNERLENPTVGNQHRLTASIARECDHGVSRGTSMVWCSCV